MRRPRAQAAKKPRRNRSAAGAGMRPGGRIPVMAAVWRPPPPWPLRIAIFIDACVHYHSIEMQRTSPDNATREVSVA